MVLQLYGQHPKEWNAKARSNSRSMLRSSFRSAVVYQTSTRLATWSR